MRRQSVYAAGALVCRLKKPVPRCRSCNRLRSGCQPDFCSSHSISPRRVGLPPFVISSSSGSDFGRSSLRNATAHARHSGSKSPSRFPVDGDGRPPQGFMSRWTGFQIHAGSILAEWFETVECINTADSFTQVTVEAVIMDSGADIGANGSQRR